MNFEDYNNTLFIVKDAAKKGLLKLVRKSHKLLNIKIITLSELKKKWFFDYDKKTIYYVSKRYNVISDVAKIYIDNLYYIKDIQDEKIFFLKNIENELRLKKLLKTSRVFHSFLSNKTIVLYDLENIDSFYRSIFAKLAKNNKIIEYSNNANASSKELYRATNKTEEIAFVASSIVKLIKKGVDINKIFLANVSNDYHFVIENTFKEFNIPVVLPSISSINGTMLVREFINLYSDDMESVISKLKDLIKDSSDETIFKLILNSVNDYAWCDDYNSVKDMILNDISKIKLPEKKLKNAVRVIDFTGDIINDDEYVFLINFNQGIIPAEHKDEDYLSDVIKKKICLSTSIEKNMMDISEVQKKIRHTKNLTVTYYQYNLSNELYLSNAYSEDLFVEKNISIDYTLSNLYNKRLLVSYLDVYKKYGAVKDELSVLFNHYKDFDYCSYDNKYSGVSKEKIRTKLNNKLVLSYTSMNTYYLCGFRYYLDYILKMNKYEDSFQTIIGSVFHSVLSVAFFPDFNFEACWNNLINNIKYKYNNMEKFFLESLKEELLLVIDTIKNQLEYTSLKKSFYEEEVQIEVDKNVNLYFKGFIDKVMYDEFDGVTYAVIIDYKTGSADLSLGGIPYGLNMQLPVYIYLLKNSNKIKNVRIGGFYLQKILDNIRDKDKRIDSLKLTGYTNSDISVIEKVDSSYCSSQVIKSLKTTSTGFSSYSKLISDEEMNRLSKIVNKKIVEASKNIYSSKFDINPKELDGKLVGCSFCKYRDICFMKNDDIIKLNSVTREELFGGEENA